MPLKLRIDGCCTIIKCVQMLLSAEIYAGVCLYILSTEQVTQWISAEPKVIRSVSFVESRKVVINSSVDTDTEAVATAFVLIHCLVLFCLSKRCDFTQFKVNIFMFQESERTSYVD